MLLNTTGAVKRMSNARVSLAISTLDICHINGNLCRRLTDKPIPMVDVLHGTITTYTWSINTWGPRPNSHHFVHILSQFCVQKVCIFSHLP